MRFIFGITLVGLLALSTAHGDIILGNLDAGAANHLPLTVGNQSGLKYRQALLFTMGSTSFELASVDLGLDLDLGGTPELQIRNTDSGDGSPGSTILASFNSPTPLTGAKFYTFTPRSPLALAANTDYWLYLLESGEDGRFWWYRNNPNITANGPFATFVSHSSSTNAGGTWTGMQSERVNFEINGQVAVPEPAAYASFCLVAVGLFWIARKKRRELSRSAA